MRSIKLNLWAVRHVTAMLCLGLLLSGCGLAGGHGSLDAGTRYQAQGNYRAAYIEAKKVLQRDNKNGEAWLLLGRASMRLGNPRDALIDFEHARDNGVPKAHWVVPMGQVLRVSQQYAKLLKIVSPDTLEEPGIKARTYVLRGDAYLGLKQSAQAKQSYQSALSLAPDDPLALAGLAQVAAIANDPDAARTYVQKALAAAPENPQTWMVKGDLAYADHDFAKAASAYQTVLGFKHPDWLPQDRFYTLTRLASAQAQQGQFAQALDSIQKLENLSPQQPYPHYLHAAVLYKQGQLNGAISQLQQVLKTQPDNVQAQFLMGAVNYAQGNYSQAEMNFSNVMGMDQGNVQARKFLALTLYRSGRSRQALDTLRPTVPGTPSDTQLLALLQKAVIEGAGVPPARASATGQASVHGTPFAQGGKALAMGQESDAIRLLKEMPAGDASTETRRNILLVMTYLRQDRPDEAIRTAAAFAAGHPKMGAAHLLYGTALVASGKRAEARVQYDRAHALDPKNIAVLLSLGSLDALEHQYKDAAGRYEAVLKLDHHNALAMDALGRIAMLQGDRPHAIKRFKQAMVAAPQSPTAYLQLMMIYSQAGQFDEAVQTAERLVKAIPDNAVALNALGVAELNAGHHGQALKALQHAVDLAPKMPLFRTNLAGAQIINKDTREARINLVQVINADPGQVTAVTLLAFMKFQDHDLPGAIALAQALQKQSATKAAGFSLEGDLYMADKSWARAAQAYQQAMKIHYARPLVIKEFQALSEGSAKEPEGVLRDWLAKHPDDAVIHLLLGQYYVTHQHNTLAADQFERVLKAYPSNINALNNLAWIYVAQHNPKARALAEKAYALAPQSPDIADTYGWALLAGNQPEKALPILMKASRAAPREPTIQYHLAVAQVRTGDKSGARSTLEALHKSGATFAEKPAEEKLYRELVGAPGN